MTEDRSQKFRRSITADLSRVYWRFGGAMATIFAAGCFAAFFVVNQQGWSPVWLVLGTCVLIAAAFFAAARLSEHTIPIERLNLSDRAIRLARMGNIACYTLFLASIPALLAGLVGIAVGAAQEGPRAARHEVGSGISRSAGYMLGALLILFGGIVSGIRMIPYLPRLISFLVMQEALTRLIQLGAAPQVIDELVRSEPGGGDCEALRPVYAACDPEGKAYLKAMVVLRCFSLRLPQEEADRRISRMELGDT